MKRIDKIMKRQIIVMIAVLAAMLTADWACAQEKTGKVTFSGGTDLVSSYTWRGVKQSPGTHIQPFLTMSIGNFSATAWGAGNFDASYRWILRWPTSPVL